jgi:L-2-hydroxyglutarate oxidase LhgO
MSPVQHTPTDIVRTALAFLWDGDWDREDYMQAHQIPHRKVGKLVIAKTYDEIPALEQLFANAVGNGVPHVRYIDGSDGIRKVEPEATGVAAIHSPETGITDWTLVAISLEKDIVGSGGVVFTGHNVVGIADCDDRITITTEASTESDKLRENKQRSFEARRVVACVGAYADRIAALTGGAREPQIVPIRGEYLVIPSDNALAGRIRGNIYPVPVEGVPFLGVHFTPTLSGDVILGPSAVLALSRDGQSGSHFSDIRAADVAQLASYVGFWRLVGRHGAYGAGEALRSAWPGAAVRRAAQYVPALRATDVRRGGRARAGVRAQAVGLHGELVDDFVFERTAGGKVVHTRNAPSPGATSALAIAEVIADYVEQT